MNNFTGNQVLSLNVLSKYGDSFIEDQSGRLVMHLEEGFKVCGNPQVNVVFTASSRKLLTIEIETTTENHSQSDCRSVEPSPIGYISTPLLNRKVRKH